MINLFYNPSVTANTSSSADQIISGWEMATKGAVGGSIFVPAPNSNASKSKAVSEPEKVIIADAPEAPEAPENQSTTTTKTILSEKSRDKNTFRKLFLEACIESRIEFDKLDTRYCYSLVLQHPKNPLICHINKPRVYLIALYSIDNATLTVTRHPRSAIDWKNIGFHIPRTYNGPMSAKTPASGRVAAGVTPVTTFQPMRYLHWRWR